MPVLDSDDLTALRALIRAELDAALAAKPAAPAPPPAPRSGSSGVTLPNYGRAKGQPIESATLDDLRYYKQGCERTLNDPAKERWHSKERALMAALDAEIARRSTVPGDVVPSAPTNTGGGEWRNDPDMDVPF